LICSYFAGIFGISSSGISSTAFVDAYDDFALLMSCHTGIHQKQQRGFSRGEDEIASTMRRCVGTRDSHIPGARYARDNINLQSLVSCLCFVL